MSWKTLLIATCAFLIACLAAITGWQAHQQREANRKIEYVIPQGTVQRIAAGQNLNVLPSTITMTLGLRDILIIRNDDSQTVQIGPYKIEPGQTFQQQFFNIGTFDLMCTIHADARMRVVVVRSS